MKTMSKLLFAALVASLAFTACKSEKEAETAEETTTTEQTETKSAKTVVEGVEIPVTVLNANLATEDNLKAVGMSDEMIAKVIEAQPFLSMNDFDALLGDTANKEELYKAIFVPFNLNTTAEADFKMIPGVGDKMAHEFEEYRPYTSVAQFRKEIGKYVDEAQVEYYLNYVFVPVELNTASNEDIKALPGVGDRMTHEFEEYRPYTSMEQFRKEIGKYVDDKELARLERLVYLKQ